MAIVLAGRLAQFILVLVGTRLATTLLPPVEMGRMALVIALTAFFALFLVYPVGMFINRRLHGWIDTDRVQSYLHWYWKYLLLVCAIAALSGYGLNKLGLATLRIDTGWLMLLVCGSLFFNTLNQTVIPSLNLLGYRKPFFVLTLATIATGYLVAVSLTLEVEPRAEYWLLGILLGQILVGWLGLQVFYARVVKNAMQKIPLSLPACLNLWAFAWPVAIAVGFNWVQMQGYRFVLEGQVGLAELGLFAAGYGISVSLLNALELVLTTYLQPEFYRRANKLPGSTQSQTWNQYAFSMLPALVFVTALVMAMASEITMVLLGPAYQGARDYVILGALAEFTRVMAGVYGMIAHIRMRTRLLILPNALAAVLTVILVVGLVPYFGAGAAALAVAGGGILSVLSMHWSMRNESFIQLPWKQLGFALVMGATLMIVVEWVHRLLPHPLTLMWALTSLVGIGLMALPIFWILLRNSVRRA